MSTTPHQEGLVIVHDQECECTICKLPDRNTITITIGRNGRDNQQFDHETWQRFHRAVRNVLHDVEATIWVDGNVGSGLWDGQYEENAVWVADVDIPALRYVRFDLERLAVRYEQDAIALAVGQTTLLPSTPWEDR